MLNYFETIVLNFNYPSILISVVYAQESITKSYIKSITLVTFLAHWSSKPISTSNHERQKLVICEHILDGTYTTTHHHPPPPPPLDGTGAAAGARISRTTHYKLSPVSSGPMDLFL